MPGHSRRKDGVASACLCPGHPFTLPPPGEGNRIWNFPMPSARDFFRFCVTFQRVVPANAGTHTPCLLVLALGQIPSATSKARGYGSLRSQGRPAESLCEAPTASQRAPQFKPYAIALPLRGRAGVGALPHNADVEWIDRSPPPHPPPPEGEAPPHRGGEGGAARGGA